MHLRKFLTKVSEPTVHLSFVSSQRSVLLEPPLVILIPESSVGEPEVKLLFNAIILSASEIVSEFTVVVVPETVKSPVIATLSFNVTLPEPLPLNTKLVSVCLDAIWSTVMLFPKDIAFPNR